MDKFLSGCVIVVGLIVLAFALNIVGTLAAVWSVFETYEAFGSVLGEITMQQVIGVFWPLSIGYSTLKGYRSLTVAEWQLSQTSKSAYKMALLNEAFSFAVGQIITAAIWVLFLLPLVVDLVSWIW